MDLMTEVVHRIRKEMRVDDSYEIHDGTTLDELGLSSLQVAELVFGLEEDLEIELEEERAAQVSTLGELVSFLNETVAGRGGLEAAR